MITPETKEQLLYLRRRLLDRAEKEMEHARTIFPGRPQREKQTGLALGYERAAMLVTDILDAP